MSDYGLQREMATWLHANRDDDEHFAPSAEPCSYCVDWAATLCEKSPLARSSASIGEGEQ